VDSILVRFGNRVRELRKKKGLSQEGLALESGLDRSYVGGVERGERNISLENIEKLAKALGVTAAALMRGV
jgi:transcriptional regulator with XRE-family HTH domain